MNRLRFFLVLLGSILSGLVGGASVAWLSQNNVLASNTPGNLMARSFILVDEHGKCRGGIFMKDNNPVIQLQNDEGKPMVDISISSDEPKLFFRDKKGKKCITLETGKKNNKLVLSDGTGKEAVELGFISGTPTINLKNRSGKNQVNLTILNDNMPIIGVGDERGNPRAGLVYKEKFGPGITIQQVDGTEDIGLFLSPSLGAKLVMRDKQHNHSIILGADAKSALIRMTGKDTTMKYGCTFGMTEYTPVLYMAPKSGGKIGAIFSKDGSPYLAIDDKHKKLWSVPEKPPKGLGK